MGLPPGREGRFCKRHQVWCPTGACADCAAIAVERDAAVAALEAGATSKASEVVGLRETGLRMTERDVAALKAAIEEDAKAHAALVEEDVQRRKQEEEERRKLEAVRLYPQMNCSCGDFQIEAGVHVAKLLSETPRQRAG